MTLDAVARAQTADKVAAWLLYVLQLVCQALLAGFLMLSIVMGRACRQDADLKICSGEYFITLFTGCAALLLLGAVATPLAIIIAGRRGNRRWPWPVAATVALTLAMWGYATAISR